MKLQKTTLVLMIAALILAIGVYFLELQQTNQQNDNQVNQQKLFDFTTADIVGLTITREINNQPQVITLVRGNEKTSLWQMQQPDNSPANDAVVDFLVGLLVETKTKAPILVNDNQFIEFGLNLPLATIEIKLRNQQIFKLILGKQTFDKGSLYAYKDEGNKNKKVFIVPLNFQNAIDRSLSEWKIAPVTTPTPK